MESELAELSFPTKIHRRRGLLLVALLPSAVLFGSPESIAQLVQREIPLLMAFLKALTTAVGHAVVPAAVVAAAAVELVVAVEVQIQLVWFALL